MTQIRIAQSVARNFTEMTKTIIDACTVKTGQRISVGLNMTGRNLLLPGYNTEDAVVYPAFWTRDPAWIAESGFISPDDVWGWITLIAETMNTDQPRHLKSGGVIPPFAVADHINLDGTPVYYPGTYASDETQGPPWGKYPPHDDQYWPVFYAYAYATLTGDWASFNRKVTIQGQPIALREVCERAYNAFFVDQETQLCFAADDLNEHIVDWGYNDSITKTGRLLFPSLLRLEAGLKLAKLCEKNDDIEKSRHYTSQAKVLRQAIVQTFVKQFGSDEYWLVSATGVGNKPDVWGSAFALYRGFVEGTMAKRIAQSLLNAFRNRTAIVDGQVGHIPQSHGYWEVARTAPGTYQNGAYWGYPIGWYVSALMQVDPKAAEELWTEYYSSLTRDWGKGLRQCAWECINPELNHYQNPGYLTTIALPFVTLKPVCGW